MSDCTTASSEPQLDIQSDCQLEVLDTKTESFGSQARRDVVTEWF